MVIHGIDDRDLVMGRSREGGLLDWCGERGCRGRDLRHGRGRVSVHDGGYGCGCGCGRENENETSQLRFQRPFRVSSRLLRGGI